MTTTFKQLNLFGGEDVITEKGEVEMSDILEYSVGDVVLLRDEENFLEVAGVDTEYNCIDVSHWNEDDRTGIAITWVQSHYKKQ